VEAVAAALAEQAAQEQIIQEGLENTQAVQE